MTQAELQTLIDTLRNETEVGANTKTRVADILDGLKEKQITAQSYSTTETLTGGTWIDGKPIYRKTKVFSGSELVSNGEIDLTVAFPNMETITKNPDVFTDWTTDNGLKTAGTIFKDVMYIIYPDVLSAREPFSLNSFDTSVFDSITLTLEYTKTTD